MNCDEIRKSFVDYYEDLGFHLLPRAPMLHPSIPMSFVMSAGLVQVETSLAHADQRNGDRFVLVQECFRHFDLDRVGSNDTHLSIFEMPGAFVFGPNGKADAIKRMWTLATSVLGIEKKRLWVSYFVGGRVFKEWLSKDEATYQAWVDIGVEKEHIVGLGPDDNYWVQGGGIDGRQTPRKAGPHTELFFDRKPGAPCGPNCGPGCRCGRFVEFSNTLFICCEQDTDRGTLVPMPEPFAETVIGSERVAMILQEAPTVFDIWDYKPIVKAIEAFVHMPDVSGPLVAESKYIIADHLKALYVLIADGAPPPGKNGRERIIKLLVRGIVTRQILLGIHDRDFLPAVIDSISHTVHNGIFASSEVKSRIIKYFSHESERFLKTVERGYRQLRHLLDENSGRTLSGSQILFLEKRKGLSHLLTAMLLQRHGLEFAEAEYEEELEVWKQQPHN